MRKLYIIIIGSLSLLLVWPNAYAQNITLSIYQAPVLIAHAGQDLEVVSGNAIQIGGNPTAQAGYGGYRYLWTPATGLDDPTLANPLAQPEETTEYLLTVTDGNNCVAQDVMTVTVKPNSIAHFSLNQELNLFPNPSSGLLHIHWSSLIQIEQIVVYNNLGKRLYTQNQIKSNSTSIDLSHYGKGFYIIQIGSPKERVSRKVWIE